MLPNDDACPQEGEGKLIYHLLSAATKVSSAPDETSTIEIFDPDEV
jgi:hypothetical protein